MISLLIKNTKLSNRSLSVTNSILYNGIYKFLNILLSFILVPITINYVNPSQYGVWLTLSSIISWMSIFDIGLGNGLRNRLTEAISVNDLKAAKEYISTAYITLAILSIFIFCIGYFISLFVNWNTLLKIDDTQENITTVAICLLLGFCLRFVFQLISTILFSFQKAHLSELIILIGNALSLLVIYTLKNYFNTKLLFLVFSLSYAPIISFLIGTLILFANKNFINLKPSLSFFRKDKITTLLSLGVKFFIIQISVLVSFSLSNFIILQLLTANDVTNYNIAYKYFSIITIINSIICAPLWSAFTSAYCKNEFTWIKKTIKILIYIWIGWVFVVFIMIIASKWFYLFWTKVDLQIPLSLSIVLAIYMLVCCWNGIFVSFINGVGKVKLQMYLSIFPIIFMLPTSYFLIKTLNFGVTGIAASMLFFNLISSSVLTFQSYLIINNKDKGIWSK